MRQHYVAAKGRGYSSVASGLHAACRPRHAPHAVPAPFIPLLRNLGVCRTAVAAGTAPQPPPDMQSVVSVGKAQERRCAMCTRSRAPLLQQCGGDRTISHSSLRRPCSASCLLAFVLVTRASAGGRMILVLSRHLHRSRTSQPPRAMLRRARGVRTLLLFMQGLTNINFGIAQSKKICAARCSQTKLRRQAVPCIAPLEPPQQPSVIQAARQG